MQNSHLGMALSLLLGLSMMVQAADVRAGGCQKDTDCKGDRVCQSGACVSPAAAPAPGPTPTAEPTAPSTAGCQTDADCPSTHQCMSGACVSGEPAAPPAAATASAPPSQGAPGGAYPPPNYGAGTPGYGTGPPGYGAGTPGYGPVPVEPQTERRSTGLMVAGIILTGLGGLGTIGGAIGTAVTATEDRTTYDYYTNSYSDDSGDPHPAPVGVLIGGGVFLITGIIFLIVGAPKVPVENAEAAKVEPLLGPGFGGMRWSF